MVLNIIGIVIIGLLFLIVSAIIFGFFLGDRERTIPISMWR